MPDLKLCRFDDNRTGLVTVRDGSPVVVDVLASTAAVGDGSAALDAVAEAGGSWRPLIDDWDRGREALLRLEALVDSGSEEVVTRALDAVTLGPPLPEPRARIFALGGNFRAHISDVDTAAAKTLRAKGTIPPWGFTVLPGTIVGHEAVITPPEWVAKLDYEVEVAIVLQEGGTHLGDHDLAIWGYTAFNDFGIRDSHFGLAEVDPGPLAWALQKNFSTGNACGPWLVVDDPLVGADVTLSMKVNGETRQSGTTASMTNSFQRTAEWLSGYFALEPGDTITSGSPAGTAIEAGADGPYLHDGDVTEASVEGVGILRNHVRMARRA